MKVYGEINYGGILTHNGVAMNLEYIADSYKHGLNLTKGYIGGGYIGSNIWTVVTTIENSTDTWGTSANASIPALYYGSWMSSHTNGYMLYTSLSNYKMSFATENVVATTSRNYGTSNSPVSITHGIGYEPDGTGYGTKGFLIANNSTNYDVLNFASDTWVAKSDANVATQPAYTQAWFDKLYGWSLGSDGVTRKFPFSSETWTSITPTPNYTLTLSYWGKGLPTKDGKSYVHPGGLVAPFMKYMHITDSYQTNPYNQTLNNDEQSPVMGQNHGYWAGGYNGVQNAHSDRVEFNTDTVINILDAPRALSSGSPMWSGY